MNRRQALVGLGAAAAYGCTATPAKMSSGLGRREIVGDIDILRRAYTQLHPGLYRYMTSDEVAGRFRLLEREVGGDAGLKGDYLALSRFCGAVRCGHTYANFYNQSDAVAAALFSDRNRLPFHFRWLAGRMVVTLNQSDDLRLTRGAEIVSIDARRPVDILRSLLPLTRADGSNDNKRRAQLEVRGVDRYETFDVYYPLLFPVRDHRFVLEVRPVGAGSVQRIEVGAIDLAQRRATMTEAMAEKDSPQWTLEFTDGVAVLKMPTWALYDSKWAWEAFLAEAFDTIASEVPKGLIVDLRGNEGGLDCGNRIIARLIDRELDISEYQRKVRYRRTPVDLDPYLDTWDNSFRTLGEDADDLGDGFLRLQPAKGVSSLKPLGPRFTGKVVVLTDAQNSSATFQFAQLIQDHGLGKLCGTPTGGNQRGINGGAFFFLRLPATGIEVDLPLIGRFPGKPRPDAGLMPDIRVEDTLADVVSGSDRVLAAAIESVGRA
jgi:hypothetical protein